MIIDCHGHYTTAPRGLALWRDAQFAGLNDPKHRYIDAVPWFTLAERAKIYEGNARRVYPRLNAKLQAAA
jgi:hypothetical protein